MANDTGDWRKIVGEPKAHVNIFDNVFDSIFAGNVNITAQSYGSMTEAVLTWESSVKKLGLVINANRSKCMITDKFIIIDLKFVLTATHLKESIILDSWVQ